MKKAMLSQPMHRKTDEEIISTRERAVRALTERGFEIVNTLFTDEWYSEEQSTERGVVNRPLMGADAVVYACLLRLKQFAQRFNLCLRRRAVYRDSVYCVPLTA